MSEKISYKGLTPKIARLVKRAYRIGMENGKRIHLDQLNLEISANRAFSDAVSAQTQKLAELLTGNKPPPFVTLAALIHNVQEWAVSIKPEDRRGLLAVLKAAAAAANEPEPAAEPCWFCDDNPQGANDPCSVCRKASSTDHAEAGQPA